MQEYSLDHPLARELWADRLLAQNFANCRHTKFIGDETNLVHLINDFQKGVGSKITFGLRLQMEQSGALDNELMEGNEGHYDTVEDSLEIHMLRFAAEGTGAIDKQRIGWNDREQVRAALTDLWVRRDETAFFNQLGGARYETNIRYTGLNPVHDPAFEGDDNHYLLLGASDEQSLASGDEFSTTHIDYCIERAKSDAFGPPIRPLRINGGEYYAMFIHTYDAQNLRQDPAWKEVQHSAMQGGAINNNPFFTGSMGVWNNTIIYESDYVCKGVNASTGARLDSVRRNVFCGAQGLCLGYGKQGGSSTTMFWREREIDFGNRLGIASGKIFGLKVSTYDFNNDGTRQRFSTIVVPTYSVAHS